MTQQDINKTFACFAADVRMIVKKTGLWSDEETENYLMDIKAFMDKMYLSKLHLILFDGQGNVLKARRYEIVEITEGSASSRPGDNNWDSYNGKELSIILSYGHQWNDLSEADKVKFKSERIIRWSPSSIDTTFTGLQKRRDKTYASSNLAIARTDIG